MGGFSNISNGRGSVLNADNVSFDGTIQGGVVTTNGQLLIGSTATPNIRVGNLTSSDGSITVTNGAGTIDLKANASISDLHVAKLIVNSQSNAGGNYTTITNALAAAVSGDTIFVMPGLTGTYTENLTLKAGVSITSFACDPLTPTVTIIGTLTFSTAGTATISNIRLQTNSANLLVVGGTSVTIVNLVSCYLNCSNNTGIAFSTANTSARINILYCTGNLGTTGITLFAHSGTGFLYISYGEFFNTGGSSTASTVSNGGVFGFLQTTMGFPLSISSSSAGTLNHFRIESSTQNATCVTTANTASVSILQSTFLSGSGSAISIGAGTTVTISSSTIVSTNANAITGLGTINYTGISFTNSQVINTTTQTGGTLTGSKVNAPSAGYLGEQISSAIASGSAVTTAPSGTPVNVTTISLTAGVWDVSAMCIGTQTGAGTGTSFSCAITVTTGGAGTFGDTAGSDSSPVISVSDRTITIPVVRVVVASTTTYYLTATTSFSSGTWKAYGRLSATRVG